MGLLSGGHALSKGWLVIGTVLCGLIAYFLARQLGSQQVDALSTAVLSSTLFAVTWYSQETRLLRLAQQRDTELRFHPWLGVKEIISEMSNDDKTLTTRQRFRIRVHNYGNTPAYNVHVEGNWAVNSIAGDPHDVFSFNVGVILPGESQCFEPVAEWELVSNMIVEVAITYCAPFGGRGRCRWSYLYGGAGNSVTKHDLHSIELSTGEQLPSAMPDVDTFTASGV